MNAGAQDCTLDFSDTPKAAGSQPSAGAAPHRPEEAPAELPVLPITLYGPVYTQASQLRGQCDDLGSTPITTATFMFGGVLVYNMDLAVSTHNPVSCTVTALDATQSISVTASRESGVIGVPIAISPTQQTPVTGSHFLEAEGGSLTAPFTVGDDPAASAGQFIWVSGEEKDLDCNSGSVVGWVTYSVNVPAGNYRLWGRTIAPDRAHDSFCVQIDETPIAPWWPEISSTWHWNSVFQTSFPLTAGEHTLRIRYREPQTKLDRLLLTDTLDLAPD